MYRETAEGGQPYAFIDWDRAGPGRRIEDVAHVCWTWLELGPTIVDVPLAARRIRTVLGGYAAPFGQVELVQVIAWWQHRRWRGIEAQARGGERAMQELVADGTAAAVRAGAVWTDDHASQLAMDA